MRIELRQAPEERLMIASPHFPFILQTLAAERSFSPTFINTIILLPATRLLWCLNGPLIGSTVTTPSFTYVRDVVIKQYSR